MRNSLIVLTLFAALSTTPLAAQESAADPLPPAAATPSAADAKAVTGQASEPKDAGKKPEKKQAAGGEAEPDCE